MTPEQKSERLSLIKETVERYRGIFVRRCVACDERFMTPYKNTKYCSECAKSEQSLTIESWAASREFEDYDEDVKRIQDAAKDGQNVECLISRLGIGGTDTDERYVVYRPNVRQFEHKKRCAFKRGNGECDCSTMSTRKKRNGPLKGRGKVFKEIDNDDT